MKKLLKFISKREVPLTAGARSAPARSDISLMPLIAGLLIAGALLNMSVTGAEPEGAKSGNFRRLNTANFFTEIAKSEYDIKWQDRVGTYQTPNRANNLRFTIYSDGFATKRRDPKGPDDLWSVSMKLKSYGVKNPLPALLTPSVQLNKNTMVLDAADVVSFHYENDERGLHQSFTIPLRPVEGNLALTLAVQLDGLSMNADASGNFVSFFHDSTGEEILRYSDIIAFDARGRALPSRMETVDDSIRLIVDDADAVYPVLVDPWQTAPHKLTEPQSGAKFGFSAQYLELQSGSLAIGAPYFDDGLTDQGKVFVYYGGSETNGWSKAGDAAYSLFGYSVACANTVPPDNISLNGDGVADLIVGAPEHSSGYGKVFVWYGDTGTAKLNTNSANVTWTGSQADGKFGTSVAAGDVTDDGFMDAIVGAPSIGGSQPGTIYLFKRAFWQSVDPKTYDSGLFRMTFGKGLFVAVGQRGLVLTSTNFVEWTRQRSDVFHDLYDVAFIGNRFIAVGAHTIVSSEDGVDWTVHDHPAAINLLKITEWKDTLVVGGEGGTILQSASFSRPTLLQAVGVNGNFEFSIIDQPGRIYRIEAATNLSSPIWTSVGTVTNEQGFVKFVDREPRAASSRFFRAVRLR